jgi:hypothetical protein
MGTTKRETQNQTGAIVFIADEFVFVHLPKAGGSTVAKVMQRKASNTFCLRAHLTLEQINDSFTDRFIFTFVRHPKTWRESWFRHMQANHRKLWPYHTDMWLARRDGVRTYEQAIRWCLKNKDMCCINLFPQYYQGRGKTRAQVFRMEHMKEDLQIVWHKLDWGELNDFKPTNKGKPADLSCSPELMQRYLEVEKPIIQKFYS